MSSDRGIVRQHWSLHSARNPTGCDACGVIVPPKSAATAGEYWRGKGGERGVAKLRTVCCVCHFLLGLPDDGWSEAPDGRKTIAASTCAPGRDA